MPHEVPYINIGNDPTLRRLTEQVRKSGRRAILRGENGEAVAMLVPLAPTRADQAPASTTASPRSAKARFLRHFQSVPALAIPRTDNELTELAAEEAVQEFARKGY